MACPAAGYSETPPPPAIYCPANGYVNPNDPDDPWEQVFPEYVPEEGLPIISNPATDEIVLLCSNQVGGVVQFYCNRNTGNVDWELYGDGDILLDSASSSATSLTFNLLDRTDGYLANGIYYYVIKLKPATGYFTQFRCYSYSTVYPFVEAYINAPNLTTFDLSGQTLLKKCWMCATMDSLNNSTSYKGFNGDINLVDLTLPTSMALQTNLEYWFVSTGLTRLLLPSNMPALTTMLYTFRYSKIREVIMPDVSPLLWKLEYTFADTLIQEVAIKDCTTLSLNNTFYNAVELISVNYPTSWSCSYLSATYSNCKKLIKAGSNNNYEVVFNLTDGSYLSNPIGGTYYIKKLIFNGSANLATSLSSLTQSNVYALEECILPENMNGLTSFNGNYTGHCASLKKLGLPLSMSNLAGSIGLLSTGAKNVEEITTCNNWGSNVLNFGIGATAYKLKRFDQPALRTTSLSIAGTSSIQGALEYVDVDWSYLTQNVDLRYNNLSASEIDRIFTALPVLSGKTISINGNPGAATCDRSIATAKGWTVS